MKFNVIFISMAIGLLSHSVISAPVGNSNNDVTDNDNNVDATSFHMDVPGADINIDDNEEKSSMKHQDNDNEDDVNKKSSDNDDMAATDGDATTTTTEDDDQDTSTLEKRGLFGNSDTLSASSDGINSPDAGLYLGGNKNNDLSDEDLMGLTKRRLGGGLSATRNGLDVAPLGIHLGRDSNDPNMATASDSVQLNDLTSLFTKRDESNDDDGDDLNETVSSTSSSSSTKTTDTMDDYDDDNDIDGSEDIISKREDNSQDPILSDSNTEDMDDVNDNNIEKRDRIVSSAHDHVARYGVVPGNYPNRYISDDITDAMT